MGALGVAVLVWDLWDHHHTKQANLPILRESLFDYLDEMQLGLEKETLAVVDELGDAIRGVFRG